MVAWSSVISHALYGGVAVYTTGVYFNTWSPAHISFGILALRSFLGIINGLTEEDNDNVKKAYEFVDNVTWFFAFPFYACHLWLGHGVRQEYAYIHPIVALIPFGMYLAEKDYEDASAALMLGNAISAAYVTIITQNWFGLGATAVFAITHGVIKLENDDSGSISKEDMFNYLLALYMILAWKSWVG